MSFQSFRLGEIAMQTPLLRISSSFSRPQSIAFKVPRAPYGSGDTDDGYTLVFPNLDAFHEWRLKEEEAQVVEFVKGDTHGSKAVPPRFKEHTKLVCARHSRSGRKKYVKKHPERVRKVPSRKIEGQGCPASISFKTYFDTEEVRACYISTHSHEIGPANLPFTRKGRKSGSVKKDENENGFADAVSIIAPLPPQQQQQQQQQTQPPPPQPGYQQQQQQPQPQPVFQTYYAPVPVPVPAPPLPTDRWQNMEALFHSILSHARAPPPGFAYPVASVAALESILVRLYLESPATGVQMQQQGQIHAQQQVQQVQDHQHQEEDDDDDGEASS